MTLDDLIALNDEIAALVRAGVPLEAGLAADGRRHARPAWAKSPPRGPQRTARGEPLDQAIMQDAGQLPPAYRAVVQAGLRAGRLPAALEAVAASARRLAETHRAVLVGRDLSAAGVPGGLVRTDFLTCTVVAAALAKMFFAFHVPGYGFVAAMASAGHWARYWGPAVSDPRDRAAGLAWWFASTRASTLHSRRSDWLFGWLPWVRSDAAMVADGHVPGNPCPAGRKPNAAWPKR